MGWPLLFFTRRAHYSSTCSNSNYIAACLCAKHNLFFSHGNVHNRFHKVDLSESTITYSIKQYITKNKESTILKYVSKSQLLYGTCINISFFFPNCSFKLLSATAIEKGFEVINVITDYRSIQYNGFWGHQWHHGCAISISVPFSCNIKCLLRNRDHSLKPCFQLDYMLVSSQSFFICSP